MKTERRLFVQFNKNNAKKFTLSISNPNPNPETIGKGVTDLVKFIIDKKAFGFEDGSEIVAFEKSWTAETVTEDVTVQI